jgi:hypothetical protein
LFRNNGVLERGIGFVLIPFISMVTGYITLGQKSAIKNKLDVKLWMINNQFSRRNLPTETRLAFAYRFKELEAEKAKERQGAGNDLVESDTNIRLPVTLSGNPENSKTLEIIAQKAGVGYSTAFQYDAIQRKGTEEQKAEVAEGKSSIKKVYTQIQKAERLKKNKATEWLRGLCTL